MRGTDLATHFAAHPQAYPLMDFPTYLDALLACLSIIPEDIVIHRLTGDGKKQLLIAPLWSANKKFVLNSIQREMKCRNFLQGMHCKETPDRKKSIVVCADGILLAHTVFVDFQETVDILSDRLGYLVVKKGE